MIEINDTPLALRYMKKNNFKALFDSDVTAITKLFFFEKGSCIITEGVIPDYLFFIVEGECRYISLASTGSLVYYGGSNHFRVIGEVASLWNYPPTSSVQAVKDSYCLAINLNEHREMLLNDNRFLRFIAHFLASTVTKLDNTITAHTNSNVQSRLAAFILQNSYNDVFSCTLVTTAEAVGASYRHILRIMSALCRQSILRKDKRRYHLQNRVALSDMASDSYGYFDL